MTGNISSTQRAATLAAAESAKTGQPVEQGTKFADLLAQELGANDAYMDALQQVSAADESGYVTSMSMSASSFAMFMKKTEAEALQRAKEALQRGEDVEEAAVEAEAEAEETATSGGSLLTSLFGEGAGLSDMLTLVCMMLGSGGMGGSDDSSGGFGSGMSMMLGSLLSAVSQKNAASQENSRYDQPADGYQSKEV